jgi:DNA polymerase III gamma/tau subunit
LKPRRLVSTLEPIKCDILVSKLAVSSGFNLCAATTWQHAVFVEAERRRLAKGAFARWLKKVEEGQRIRIAMAKLVYRAQAAAFTRRLHDVAREAEVAKTQRKQRRAEEARLKTEAEAAAANAKAEAAEAEAAELRRKVEQLTAAREQEKARRQMEEAAAAAKAKAEEEAAAVVAAKAKEEEAAAADKAKAEEAAAAAKAKEEEVAAAVAAESAAEAARQADEADEADYGGGGGGGNYDDDDDDVAGRSPFSPLHAPVTKVPNPAREASNRPTKTRKPRKTKATGRKPQGSGKDYVFFTNRPGHADENEVRQVAEGREQSGVDSYRQ